MWLYGVAVDVELHVVETSALGEESAGVDANGGWEAEFGATIVVLHPGKGVCGGGHDDAAGRLTNDRGVDEYGLSRESDYWNLKAQRIESVESDALTISGPWYFEQTWVWPHVSVAVSRNEFKL